MQGRGGGWARRDGRPTRPLTGAGCYGRADTAPPDEGGMMSTTKSDGVEVTGLTLERRAPNDGLLDTGA